MAGLLCAGMVVACAPDSGTPARAERPLGLGVDLANMDRSVRPQDDFFRFVNGGWLASNEIPADRSRWGSFDALNEAAEENVLAIVREAAATDAAEGSDARKVGDLFRSFMDTETIEARGIAPIEADLARIAALRSHDDLVAYWGDPLTATAPFGFYVWQDPQQSDVYITSLTQSGLGMPDRDYYLNDDERFSTLRTQYLAHIAQMFELAGIEGGANAAARIMVLETRIARDHWTRIQNRDRNATYNKMTVAELSGSAPGFDWPAYFAAGGVGSIDEVVVRQPNYVASAATFYREAPLADWQAYHRYHLLRTNAAYLPEPFVAAHFDFFGRTLSGQPEMRAREKRGVGVVENVLGFMVGKLYVDRHFPPEAKARMDALVANLRAEFRVAIDALEWMSDETKVEAQAKLAKFNTKIGYPDVWRDYGCVEIAADDLVGNIRRSAACEHERMVNRLGQPVDRDEWLMTPQTVNAYYLSTMNEIVFPAAILQPPFFNVEADDAVNYGAIGGVIGHEITHGFDDQGRRSDGDGNLRDWWSEQDEAQFGTRAQLMIDQYSGYEPIEGAFIQGGLSLGENIADLGGLTVSYHAYLRSLNGSEPPVIEGFTGPQRVFLGWGQVWRIMYREEALRRQLVTGPHSPGEFRVRGPLSNMPEFYEAFGVQEGDGMYRPEDVRVKIW
ncbi:MAG: M13 family peptidase [Xanthomonadaceae bacterium]|nr:M13 family peptidase [Xanthomonadaceae bacterium]